MPHRIYDSAEFKALPHSAVGVLLLLCRKYTGFNNGSISLGVREAAATCKCSQMTACRAFRKLVIAKLIECTHKGHMVPDIGRPDIASQWLVTFLPLSK